MAESVLNNDFKPAIVIPVYNHEVAIENTLNQVLKYGYPIVLVNDGSSEKCKNVLEKLTQNVVSEVVRRNENLPPTEAIKITTMAGCSAVKK